MLCECGKPTVGSNRKCYSCKSKASYARHKEKYAAKARAYYLEHKDTIKAQAKRWQKENPKAHYQIRKRHDAKNQDQVRGRQRRFYMRHPERVLLWNRKNKWRRRARQQAIQFLAATELLTMKTLTKSIKDLIAEAHFKINAGAQSIAEGCKLYVQALDQDVDAARKFMRERGISEAFLDLFESVGRGRIHPRLLVMPCPANVRLQRMPLAEQDRLLTAGVEVVQWTGNESKVVVKSVSELTKQEAESALDSTGNVSHAVQIERARRRVLTNAYKLPPYSLDGDTLYARENCRIPLAELERLAAEARKAHDAKLKTIDV